MSVVVVRAEVWGKTQGREQFQSRCWRCSKIEVTECGDEAPSEKGVSDAFMGDPDLADLGPRGSLAGGAQVEFDGRVLGENGIELLPSGKATFEAGLGGLNCFLNSGFAGGARHGTITG